MTESDATPTAPEQTAPEQTGNDDLSPQALRAELDRARREAAKYRERAREFGSDEAYAQAKDAVAAVAKAEQEKKTEIERMTERSEGLLHRATSAETEVAKLRAALGAGVELSQVDEFASRLRGDTPDELAADAVSLAKFFIPAAPARRGDPSQAAGRDVTTAADPLQAALESKLSIGR